MFKTMAITLAMAALLLGACGSAGAPGATETTFADAAQAESDSAFVRHLQEELNFLGYHAGHVDGVWGPATAEAIRAFQADSGLEETGDYDPETAAALQTAAGGAGALTIEALQQDLADLGYYRGIVDGEFGPETAQAVRAFQADHDLDETGVITGETVTTLVDRHAVEVEQEHIAAAKANGIGGVENLPTGTKPGRMTG